MHLTIESIGVGSVRPRRIILAVDPGITVESLPTGVRRMMRRGLEILESSQQIGPHTKYFPYVATSDKHRYPLVTGDDDTLYPRKWLEQLQAAARRHPGEVHCFRAHRAALKSGAFLPYNSWAPTSDTEPSILNFATGVSGVIYPPRVLNALNAHGDSFLQVCPRADDIWLHFIAVITETPIRQLNNRPRKFPEIWGSQRNALHTGNTANRENDVQISATYTRKAIDLLANAQ